MTRTADPFDLTGKNVLITGGGSGIGLATAQLVARLGGRVLLVARSEDRLEAALRSLEGTGHRWVSLDLAQTSKITGLLKEEAKTWGRLDGLVHSAGIQLTRPLQVTTPKSLREVFAINLDAAVELVRGFRQRQVVAAGGGSVVLLSSVMGLVGQPGLAAYSASKGALVSLVRSLGVELAAAAIRVNCVAPGHVTTPMAEQVAASLTEEQLAKIQDMHPLGFGRPEDVAASVAFLLAEGSRWITGTTLVVDGGYTAH